MRQRYAAKADKAQPDIVKAVKAAGWLTWIIGRPVDLLCYKAGKGFRLMECKTAQGKKNPKAVIDKRQREQIEFIEATGTPRVTTPEEALRFLGEIA